MIGNAIKKIEIEINESNEEILKNYLTGALHDGSLTTGHHVKYFQRDKNWITHVIKPCLENAYGLTFGPKAMYWDHSKWVLHFGNQYVWNDLLHRRQQNLNQLSC
ncbi:MAG: hypothetical protein ACFFDP_11415 [Promethearchaeota archaeon]